MSKVSFAKVPGAGSSAAVEDPAIPANAEVVDSTPQNLPAVQHSQAPSTQRFFAGDEEDSEPDRGDVRLPRLNLVQGMSDAKLKGVGPEGSFVLKQTLLIPQPARIVVAGCSKKRYAEKQLKFGEGEVRYADTLEEVHRLGGTDQWKLSRECKDKDGIPVSRKPWFTPMITAIVLIEKPAVLAKPEDEDHYSAVAEDGKAFAACVYTVKSTSFGSFYVPLASERSALLATGWSARYIKLTTRQPRAWEPVVDILEPTSEAVRKLARSVLI